MSPVEGHGIFMRYLCTTATGRYSENRVEEWLSPTIIVTALPHVLLISCLR